MDKFLNRIDELIGHISPIDTLTVMLLNRVVPTVKASAIGCGSVCLCIYNPRFDTSDVQFYYSGSGVCSCNHITVSGNAC